MSDLLKLLSAPRPTETDLAERLSEQGRRNNVLYGARLEADERYNNGDAKDAFIAGALWNSGYAS
jgi:hypothetical protein